jgi:endonuclease/exonuclease/phosphatase family metal-dependent hydrolase
MDSTLSGIKRSREPPGLIERLVAALPALDRKGRGKEPNEYLVASAPHHVPDVSPGCLRVATFNILDDERVRGGMGGLHSTWPTRRVNMVRVMLALDADVYLLQELSSRHEDHEYPPSWNSVRFLCEVFADYKLVTCKKGVHHGGVGVLYRATAHPTRGVHLAPAGDAAGGGVVRRTLPVPASMRDAKQCGSVVHVPLECKGLAPAGSSSDAAGSPSSRPPPPLVFSSAHITLFTAGNVLLSSNKAAAHLGAHLGRDLLRLPAANGGAPVILGGDFNAGAEGKRMRTGGEKPSLCVGESRRGWSRHSARLASWRAGTFPSRYGELTLGVDRTADSEDEWSEDEAHGAGGPTAWPPPAGTELCRDLWRDASVRTHIYGGLQRGSTCLSAELQRGLDGLQGIEARARVQCWPEGGRCTDLGHIDWLLTSPAAPPSASPSGGGGGAAATVRARLAGVCTEKVCPPLPPADWSQVGGGVPRDGCIFPSDHYPVWVDLEVT